MGFPSDSVIKNQAANRGDTGSISWRRKQQPTPAFLPGKSCGQRSLAGYSPGSFKEVDATSVTNCFLCIHTESRLIKNLSIEMFS